MTPAAPPDTSSGTPTLAVDGAGIAEVVFDAPGRSVNLLTEDVMDRLSALVEELREDARTGEVKGVLFRSGKPAAFIAGADIDAIDAIESPDQGAAAARAGQAVFGAIEALPVPTLCAIHGACMGGGTELALACRYRVISDHPSSRMGLPEVQLGILPAWGGTTRLPRLIGLQAALDLLLTGKQVEGEKARSLGLVEEVLPGANFQEAARDFLQARIEEGPHPTGARRNVLKRVMEDTAPGRALILRTARKRVQSKTGGHYPAPLRILDALAASMGRPVEKALEEEARAAGELLVTRVSKNLIHVFRLREAARKGTGVEGEVKPRPVSSMGIVGAGVMGGGIAQLAARKEIQVRMKDIRHDAVASGLRHARSRFDAERKRGRMDRRQVERAMERISGGIDFAGFGTVDLVVEAVVEKMDVKRSVLREVEDEVPGECILTSNTSTLSIQEMGEALERPERFCGMHFFNPVHRMPLVEVIRGPRSGDEAVASVYALAVRLGKVPVVVKDGPGFLVNRILGPYLNEAAFLLSEGASVEAVDRAATAFGMPMGPLRLVDEVGIDIAGHAGAVLHEAFGRRMAPAPPLAALADSERLGVKGGLGFYRYDDGQEKGVDPEIYELLGDAVPRERISIAEEEIRARLLLVMINEAAHILEEGITDSAGDVDLAMIMGTGFPPFRGGLLRFADEVHPRILLERLREYEAKHGTRFTPAPLLEELAEAGRGFHHAYPGPQGS
jgi:3-hydroxyacyl-CoA dehydrogenase / enoyl-CoA hydratase / 3-hydroxybutyryl-CoA epimerase